MSIAYVQVAYSTKKKNQPIIFKFHRKKKKKKMSACDIIQWIRVRLSIGLNASDEVVNKFYNENGNSEEEYWNSSLKDLHNKTTIYYVIPDEGLFHYGQNDNLWNIHRNTHEVIQIMVFYNPVGEESQSDDYFHCSILRSALPSVGSLSESQLDDFLIPEYPDENNCVIEWGIKLGIILSTESEREFNTNQDCVSIALQEYTYWTNRCEKLLPYRELFASDKYQKILSLWESHSDKRWPTLYASLITAAAEAERKYADSSLIVNPLTVVTNILPQKVGLDPLWNICAPLHVSLAITTLCSRHDCERGDLERVYMKSIEDILLKCREYLDPSTLFVVQDFEKQPDILKDNNLESENIHIRGSDTSLHTTKPDKLLCVTQSSTKLEKVISLLTQIEDQYKQLSSCDLLVQNTNWPVNTRRVFSSLSLLKERSEDAQGILKDLSNSQPSIIEDVSGYIRFREIVKVIEGLQFDFCDAGHTANFKIFLKDWKYAISSKPGEPLPATRCLLKRIVTPSADEQYPMSTLLSSFTAASNKVSDNCFIRSREGLSEKEIIVLLEQEKEVLCQKLFEANQTIDENRKAITSLTSENQRIQLVIKSLSVS